MKVLKFCVLLLLISVISSSYADYNRKQWKHWTDDNKDCENTRAEVLIRDSIEDVVLNENCTVTSGYWHDSYSEFSYGVAKSVDVDHVVPLHNAYQSGGWAWTKDKKAKYANWMPGLVVSSAWKNRQKGSKDPSQWMPDDGAPLSGCDYIQRWVEIKREWNMLIKIEVAELWFQCIQKDETQ